MRDPNQIARAHDLLLPIVLGEVDISASDDPQGVKRAAHIAAATLCWVLEHDHNTQFPEWLASIEADLTKAGYSLVEQPPPEKN